MATLIERLRAEDESAIKELYKDYYHHCKWVILNNGGTDEQAQEVFQEVILSLWEKVKRPDFEIKSTMKGYLYNSCKYTWWGMKRKSQDYESLDTLHNVPDEDEIEEKTEKERKIELMNGCIASLGEGCQQLLEQTYFKKLKDKEIAELTGLKPNYVRSKRLRCMNRIKKCIEQKQNNHG